MGNETYYLKQFVAEKKMTNDSIIDKNELEKYFLETVNISYPTLRNYFYVLKMLKILERTKDKKAYKLNKIILDSSRD